MRVSIRCRCAPAWRANQAERRPPLRVRSSRRRCIVDGMLGGAVMALQRNGPRRENAAAVQNCAAMFSQKGHCGAAAVNHASIIHVEQTARARNRGLLSLAVNVNAGIVDPGVKPVEFFDREIRHLPDRKIAHIATKYSASPPWFRMRAVISFKARSSRPLRITFAPCRAASWAVSMPMPLDASVMTTTCSFNFLSLAFEVMSRASARKTDDAPAMAASSKSVSMTDAATGRCQISPRLWLRTLVRAWRGACRRIQSSSWLIHGICSQNNAPPIILPADRSCFYCRARHLRLSKAGPSKILGSRGKNKDRVDGTDNPVHQTVWPDFRIRVTKGC
jgi:hypothetical protein